MALPRSVLSWGLLAYGVPMPSAEEAGAFGAYIADRMDFMGPQNVNAGVKMHRRTGVRP